MKRLGVLCAAAAVFVLGVAPAQSVHSQWAGSGAAVGTLTYDHLAGLDAMCTSAKFELAIDAPAFVLRTPDGPTVVPLSLRGSGSGGCDSERTAAGSFVADLQAGEMRCALRAGYQRLGSAVVVMAGEPTCVYGDGRTAPGYGWMFELAWADGRLAGTATYAP